MRILVVSAHCADFCSRSGGVIARHARAGDEVHVIALTYGERSESGGLYADGAKPSLDEVRAVRREEALQAAEVLGAGIEFWDWNDLRFEYTQERVLLLAEALRRHRPDLVLTHHGPDPQSVDHDSTYRLTMRAVQVAGAPGLESERAPLRRPEVLLFEATIPLTELEGFVPDLYVDITPVWETKLEALRAFARAQGVLQEWYTDRARLRAFQAARLSGRSDIAYAEAFERTSPWVGDGLPVSVR